MTTVLIVEDEPVNMKLESELLKMHGYNVLEAENGKVGVELALKFRPDIILMDIEMPVMDGLSAIRMLKSNPDSKAIKIIVVTARAMVGDKEMILAAGADHYLSKPFKYNEFLEIVTQSLNG